MWDNEKKKERMVILWLIILFMNFIVIEIYVLLK